MTGRDADRGQGLARSLGERVQFPAADITDPGAAEILGHACIAPSAPSAPSAAVVNSAALDHTDELVSTPTARIREVFELNTFGTIAIMQAAARSMPERGGSIVNITSRLAFVGVPTMAVYAASEGAVHAGFRPCRE